MGQRADFRAGQRVHIRSDAPSDFAGYYGVIMHVGRDLCDVRIRYKPRGSKVSSTYIGAFPKQDLESLQKPVDLALFGERDRPPLWARPLWWALFAVVVGLVLWQVFTWRMG